MGKLLTWWDDKEIRHANEVYIAAVAVLAIAMLVGGYFLLF